VYSYSTKMFNGRAKPIRITNVWVSGVLLYLNTHTYIHTYIPTHTYTHTPTHIYTHTRSNACARAPLVSFAVLCFQ